MRPLRFARDRGLVISGYWMANLLNRRYWILSPLLSAGFVLFVFIYAAQAALLRDIRIGEYENFTRIVFEFDTPPEPEQVASLSSGQMTVIFAHASAGLIRKIPVEKSQHIKNIQIWNKKNQLSAVLSFDFVRFRHQSFPLKNPPRIVLDIQPLDGAPNTKATTPPAKPESGDGNLRQVEASKIPNATSPNLRESSLAVQEAEHAGTNRSSPISEENLKAKPAAQVSGIKYRGETSSEVPITAPAAGSPKTAKQSSRLQFFLVVALVLITIVILVLLLLMLLSRHRWADDKSRLNAREFLQNQDKHIASLDARIQEQLKRYEEV